MLTLLILKEITFILAFLGIATFGFVGTWNEYKKRKTIEVNVKEMHEKVANKLLEWADDEKPIMLNVDQDKLVDKTIEEIERRKQIGGGFQ